MTTPSNLTAAVDNYWQHTNELLRECQRHCYIIRAREVLDDCYDKLQESAVECLALKERVLEVADEDLANALLSIEFMLRALVNEISMWIALKEERAEGAWDYLIVAQGCVRGALKAHHIGTALEDYAKHLHYIEHIVFPPQTFVSSAHVVDHYDCSICGKEYGTCGHVVGRPYMGQLCSRIARGIKSIDHVALIVDGDPFDKRCRTTSIEADDVERDTLTWKAMPPRSPEEEANNPRPEPKFKRMTACILRADCEPGV